MSDPSDSGFIAIHGNHLEDLRQSLITILRTAPLEPFDEDVVLVQSNGIAQWLKQSIAADPSDDQSVGGIGIAADLDFKLPSEFIWAVYRSILGETEVPPISPYDKRPLSWRLFGLLPELVANDEAYAPLRRFIDGDQSDVRRFQLAEKLADLFDQYQVYRADWLSHWELGENGTPDFSGRERPLEPQELWQPKLWRAINEHIGAELGQTSRSRIHLRFIDHARKLRALPSDRVLPKRVFVFGVSSLPWQTLEALEVLSRFVQVIFCVLNPSQYHWAEIVSDRELLTAERRRGIQKSRFQPGCELEQLHGHANPLLAGWGKQGRDFLRMLDQFDDTEARASSYALYKNQIDLFFPHSTADSPCLLHQLQDDIYDLTDLSEIATRDLQLQHDHSVAFHIAHSPLREVEILHDQLLAAFNADANLKPRDVMVMVPDINAYAPFIKAVFSQYQDDPQLHIPYNIADLGQRGQNPLLTALEILLGLPESRCSVTEVMSLLEAPALRARFNIAESDLELIHQWIAGTHIRWGLDAQQRERSENPAIGERNTWLSGLRSMLLGFALGQHESWMGVQGYAEISGSEIAIAGNLARFIEALQRASVALAQDQSAEQWVTQVQQLLADFFDAADPADELLIDRIKNQLGRWQDELHIAGATELLVPLIIVRERVMSAMDETNLRQRFLSGSVNFSTLMPMRSIPFKMICLLGMNDGDYPRSRTPMDFDLMTREYRPGDRSRRNDDRYLFLEALLSARQRLYISWVGRSILDDSERPASVLVEQLQDYINQFWRSGEDSKSCCTLLTTTHPLQAFSPRYYPPANRPDSLPEALSTRRLFTFNPHWRDALKPKLETNQGSEHPLTYLQPDEPIDFKALTSFLKDPIAYFYSQRLGIWFSELKDTDTDNEVFAFNHLQRAILESQLIQNVVLKSTTQSSFDENLQQELERLARSGALGVASLEQHLSQTISASLPNLFERYSALLEQWPIVATDVPFNYSFDDPAGSVEVADRINGLRRDPTGALARVHISRSRLMSGKKVRYAKLLSEWLVHLAGQSMGLSFSSYILSKEDDSLIELPPLESDYARSLMDQLLRCWIRGNTEPLPLHPDIAFTVLEAREKDPETMQGKAQEKFTDQMDNYDRGYLKRAFPQFEQFYSKDFETLADLIYLPLSHAHRSVVEEQP